MTPPGTRPTPVILVLGAEYRQAMVDVMTQRYSSDYEIVAPTSMGETIEVLTELKSGQRPVALAACEFFAGGEKATHLLAKFQKFMPSARRLVYVPVERFRGSVASMRESLAEGRLDLYLMLPQGGAGRGVPHGDLRDALGLGAVGELLGDRRHPDHRGRSVARSHPDP